MKKEVAIIAGAVLLVVVVAAAGYAFLRDDRGTEKRGSANQEFDTTQEPEAPRKPKATIPWPTYAFDNQRTHLATGFKHRPPYKKVWRLDGKDTLEFPPTVGYGRVYLAQQKGLFFAIDGKTGKVRWKRNFKRCAASSPAVGRGTVYQAYMDFVDCPQGRSGASGFVIAMNYEDRQAALDLPLRAGRVLAAACTSARCTSAPGTARSTRSTPAPAAGAGPSPATRRSTPRRPTRRGRSSSPPTPGTLYALDARTGRKRWSAKQSSEFFYATPTVAYGRVFIGNTDGTMYAYGARSGRLLWAKPLGLLHLRRRGRGQEARVHRHLRRLRLLAQRGHRRRGVAQVGARGGARIADDHERAGLLLHLRHVRLGGVADGEAGGRTARSPTARAPGACAGGSTRGSTRARWWPTRSGCT